MLAVLRLAALALAAIILVPAGAHLFELPGKIGIERDAYFTVQAIYAGWALFGLPIFAAILVEGALYLAERRRDRAAARAALAACALTVLSLIVFFIWVYPANQATANWTRMPDGWQALRRQWEYGHAANAAILFAAFLATGRAAIGSRRER